MDDEPSSITSGRRRSLSGNFSIFATELDDTDSEDLFVHLEERGRQKPKYVKFNDPQGHAQRLYYIIAAWLSYSNLLRVQPSNDQDPNHVLQEVFQAQNPNDCRNLNVGGLSFSDKPPANPSGHAEHVIDVSSLPF